MHYVWPRGQGDTLRVMKQAQELCARPCGETTTEKDTLAICLYVILCEREHAIDALQAKLEDQRIERWHATFNAAMSGLADKIGSEMLDGRAVYNSADVVADACAIATRAHNQLPPRLP